MTRDTGRFPFFLSTIAAPALLGAVLLASIPETPALATIRFVHPDGSGDCPTIQAAWDASVDGDEIWLTDGVFLGPGNREVEFDYSTVKIRSESLDPESCVIDFQWHPIGHGGTDIRFEGITFRHGTTHTFVYDPVYLDCVFDGCYGVVSCPDVCVMERCSARNCTGLLVDAQYAVYGTDCEFMANDRVARCNYIRLTGCSLRLNTGLLLVTYAVTGSIFYPGRLILTDCQFLRNSDHCGELFGSHAEIERCTMADNGKACLGLFSVDLQNWFTSVAIRHSTFTDNNTVAYNEMADLANYSAWSQITIDDCIFAFAAHGYPVDSYDGTMQVGCTDIFGNPGGDWVGGIEDWADAPGNISLDPLFCPNQIDTWYLDRRSPCAPGSPQRPLCELAGAWDANCGTVTSADEGAARDPGLWIRPNPMRAGGTIAFRIERPGPVRLSLFDAGGRLLRCIFEGNQPMGPQSVTWDGRDARGAVVPSGVYYLKFDGSRSEAKHLTFVR